MPLSFRAVGISDVVKKTNMLVNKTRDMNTPLSKIAAMAHSKVIDHFAKERGPDYKWEPLRPGTIAKRRKRSSKPLQDTGRLRASIRSLSFKDYAIVFTNMVYSGTHQYGARKGSYGQTKFGAPIPWGTIPARSFMWISKDDIKRFGDIIAAYIRSL